MKPSPRKPKRHEEAGDHLGHRIYALLYVIASFHPNYEVKGKIEDPEYSCPRCRCSLGQARRRCRWPRVQGRELEEPEMKLVTTLLLRVESQDLQRSEERGVLRVLLSDDG
jgi:hypothetical protein